MGKNLGQIRSNTYVAYADSSTGSGFSLTPANKNYIAVLVTGQEIASPQQSDFDGLWTLINPSSLETLPDGVTRIATVQARVDLDQGSMRNLNTTPRNILPSISSGQQYELLKVTSHFNNANTTYLNGGDLQLVNESGIVVAQTGSTAYVGTTDMVVDWEIVPHEDVKFNNLGLDLKTANSDPGSGGDGFLTIHIIYIIKDFN